MPDDGPEQRHVSRDLDAARSAYARNDAAASARAHGSAVGLGGDGGDVGGCSTSEGGHATTNDADAVREEVLRGLWVGLTSALLLSSLLHCVHAFFLPSPQHALSRLRCSLRCSPSTPYPAGSSGPSIGDSHTGSNPTYDRERKRESLSCATTRRGGSRD